MNFQSIFRSFQKIFILFILLIVFLIGEASFASVSYPPSFEMPEGTIIEHLRLNVPKSDLEAWIFAEKNSWEPWLSKKSGFLGRQLLWDQQKQEAILLITWESREKWKNIPNSEIDSVQKHFEKIAREATGKDKGNPFPLVFEGELFPQ